MTISLLDVTLSVLPGNDTFEYFLHYVWKVIIEDIGVCTGWEGIVVFQEAVR